MNMNMGQMNSMPQNNNMNNMGNFGMQNMNQMQQPNNMPNFGLQNMNQNNNHGPSNFANGMQQMN